ncbi:MAG: RHS repeat-associated core domain-containing protein, partial [Cyanothece sp. SIO2G6]|nr:RHS repeat-associated core domain-containing protein [Cyanothece sp. SIO2G6]
TTTIEYQYNLDGVRVSSTVNGEETRYLIDTNRPYAEVVEEYTPGQTPDVSYIHGIEVISQTQDSESNVYLYDGHSGARKLTDETGQVTDSYTFDAYGNILDFTGTSENNYLYRGEQDDPNVDLQYLRARYYDTDTGRFISTDPFDGWQEVPISRHRYVYGNNNPVMNIDPSGLFSLNRQAAANAILGVLQSSSFQAAAIGTSFGLSQGITGLLASQRDGGLSWDGVGVSFSRNIGSYDVGNTLVAALSENFGGRRTFGMWTIYSIGYGFSALQFAPLPIVGEFLDNWSFISTPISITSPAYFEPRVLSLSGGFVQLSGNAVFGPAGLSHQSYFMGYGMVRSDDADNFGTGHWNPLGGTRGWASPGLSFDYGISIPVFSEDILEAPTPIDR